MTSRELPDPLVLVARALGCQLDSLSYDSGLNNHPDWDSFGHVQVILAIESEYGIDISDDDVLRFAKVQEIVALYNELQEKINHE